MHVIPKLDSLTRDSHLDARFVLNESKMEALTQEEVQREVNTL